MSRVGNRIGSAPRIYRTITVDLRCAMEQADVARLESDIAIQFERPSNPEVWLPS